MLQTVILAAVRGALLGKQPPRPHYAQIQELFAGATARNDTDLLPRSISLQTDEAEAQTPKLANPT